VGTTVRGRKYEVNIAKTTAIARVVNRYLATPARRNAGTKTMKMDSVAISVGVAI
jgi:hypothetical protein